MRIREIKITNFRAFSGKSFRIDLLKGENLVICGENGSGKSSIFQALRDFFNAARLKTNIESHPYRNFFAEEAKQIADAENKRTSYAETSIAIKFLTDSITRVNPNTGKQRRLEYFWTNAKNRDGSEKTNIQQIANQGIHITKGFIDYKGLLKTYFLQPEFSDVNIFDFLVNEVLAELRSLSSGKSFADLFAEIQTSVIELNSMREKAREATDREAMEDLLTAVQETEEVIKKAIVVFDEELKLYTETIIQKANEFLRKFDKNLSIKLSPEAVELYQDGLFQSGMYALRNLRVNLHTTFFGQEQNFHHQFLNEARLSAIAVSIYLASFLVNPQAGIKILALDDLLIGLDLANRLPVLDILEESFSDYQIFIFTFDKFWYEILQSRFPQWLHRELITLPDRERETYQLRNPRSFWHQAEDQRRVGNYFNAANLLRSYYEQIIREFCNAQKLSVRYSLMEKHERANHFFSAIENAPEEQRPDIAVLNKTKTAVNFILNALSHGKPLAVTSTEIEKAFEAIKELEVAFRGINNAPSRTEEE